MNNCDTVLPDFYFFFNIVLDWSHFGCGLCCSISYISFSPFMLKKNQSIITLKSLSCKAIRCAAGCFQKCYRFICTASPGQHLSTGVRPTKLLPKWLCVGLTDRGGNWRLLLYVLLAPAVGRAGATGNKLTPRLWLDRARALTSPGGLALPPSCDGFLQRTEMALGAAMGRLESPTDVLIQLAMFLLVSPQTSHCRCIVSLLPPSFLMTLAFPSKPILWSSSRQHLRVCVKPFPPFW